MAILSNKNTVSGKTLMEGKDCTVTFFPSNEHGIRFFVQGQETPILASPQNVVSTDNCTVLGSNNTKVMLVEHFMAACAFASIDSLDVCLSYHEMPILDGSSLKWFNAFKEAGIVKDNNDSMVKISQPVIYSDEKSIIAATPCEEFRITYMVNYNHPDLKNRWISFGLNDNSEEIISSRTFGYLKDLEKLQQMGLAQGVNIENTVGLTEDGYTTELRSQYEPAQHKILDLIGDLYLTGINPLRLKAHIIAKEAGHKSHVEMAKKLIQTLKPS